MTGYNRRGWSRHADGGPGEGCSRRDRTTRVRSMNHCPSAEQLRQLLADALPVSDAAAVEAHAADCFACQQTLERLAAGESAPRLGHPDPASPLPSVESPDETFLRRLEAEPPWARPTAPHQPVA